MKGEKNPAQTPGRRSRRYLGKQSRLRMNFICGIARCCGGLIPPTQCGREAAATRRGRSRDFSSALTCLERRRVWRNPARVEGYSKSAELQVVLMPNSLITIQVRTNQTFRIPWLLPPRLRGALRQELTKERWRNPGSPVG